MAKVYEVVTDALEDLVVQADEAKIEQSEAKAAIRMLNDLMFSWDADGISLGFTAVSDLGDVLTVPDGALRGIKANLAIELSPKYEVDPTQAMLKKAKEGKQSCINLSFEIGSMEYPGELPQGSGNDYPGYANTTFYEDQQSTILTETGGAIALEEDTEESS